MSIYDCFMLVFRKILRTHLMDDPLDDTYFKQKHSFL